MERKNKLDEVTLANLDSKELDLIKDLEEQLDDRYFIIAFSKEEDIPKQNHI